MKTTLSGNSYFEKEAMGLAENIIDNASRLGVELVLPLDAIVSDDINNIKNTSIKDIKEFNENDCGFDVGPTTSSLFIEKLKGSKTIVWNGPLGAFEHEPFNNATIKIANAIKNNTKLLNIITLAGGGETISAIKMANAEEGFSYISKAGGAFLEWLEGKESPGVKALEENQLS